MLKLIACLGGILLILATAEILWRDKVLKGEYHRKFIHITVGCFVASWPWLLSWKTIQILGLCMLVVVLLNRYHKFWHFAGNIKRESYGDAFFAIIITTCALLTTNKIFFAIAILHMALADGFAAIVGIQFGRQLRYKVFHQTKTVLGSMAFWFISICILGVGVLFVHGQIDFTHYALLLIALPPVLTIVENLGGLGLDNIAVPLAVLLALQIAQTT